ncbi:hypothetical protein GCM10023223_06360 [Stackebrandtia albiflava]
MPVPGAHHRRLTTRGRRTIRTGRPGGFDRGRPFGSRNPDARPESAADPTPESVSRHTGRTRRPVTVPVRGMLRGVTGPAGSAGYLPGTAVSHRTGARSRIGYEW